MPRDKFAAMASRAAAAAAAAPAPADNANDKKENDATSTTADGTGAGTESLDAPQDAAMETTVKNESQPLPTDQPLFDTEDIDLPQLPTDDNPSESATGSTDSADIETKPTAPAPARRDKLAALASRASAFGSSNDPLSEKGSTTDQRMDVKQEEHASEQTAESIAKKREEHLAKLQQRLSKRRDILNRLDRAETLTCNLLKIAAKTTDALQDLNGSPDLSELSVTYRSTLQELHPLLTKDTEELIKPYQNHTMETKQSMYAARVEMRLAKERLEVLKTFTRLEKEDRPPNDESISLKEDKHNRKRQRVEKSENSGSI